MNTKYSRQLNPQSPMTNLTNLEEMDGFLSKLLNGIRNGITTSRGQNIVINITVNVAQGGGATINNS